MEEETPKVVTFSEGLKVYIKVAIYSFGGPAAQIAVMHKLIVEEKKWVSESRFLHALNYCMLLPGPEAQQLITYIGWLLHKTKGGIIAGSLFVLPGFLSILALSLAYALFYDLTFVQGIFFGIKPAVLAIVIGAVLKIGQKVLKNGVMVSISIVSFIAIFFFEIPFPFIVITAALLGFFGGKIWKEKFYVIKDPATDQNIQPVVRPSFIKTLKTGAFWLTLWWLPVILMMVFLNEQNIFVSEALFFSKVALVTFGGAYAVLAYIAQKAVEDFGWLYPGEMMDGLGMADTTPGPLIQVVQFVGFMGAFRFSGDLDPMLAGIIASVVVTWVTFVPCFMFIFTGAPYIEMLRGNKKIGSALSAITASVVGVILNLGIWFSIHTLFYDIKEEYHFGARFLVPELHSLDYGALFITLLAFGLHFYLKWNMLKTIFVCIIFGLAFFHFV
jgi:chromate transporter